MATQREGLQNAIGGVELIHLCTVCDRQDLL